MLWLFQLWQCRVTAIAMRSGHGHPWPPTGQPLVEHVGGTAGRRDAHTLNIKQIAPI